MTRRTARVILLALVAAACGAGDPGAASPVATEPGPIAPQDDVQPPADADALVARAREMQRDLAEGGSVVNWYSTRCRLSWGLVSASDPLAVRLSKDMARFDGEQHYADVVAVEFAEPSASIVLEDPDGEWRYAERWQTEGHEWRFDDCDGADPPPLAPLPDTHAGTQDGLVARITEIRTAVDSDTTGVYQWLSERCRQAALEELDHWMSVLATSGYDLVLGQQAVLEAHVESIDPGREAATAPVFPGTWLASGNGTDRWAYERGSWYFDGCPRPGESLAKVDRAVAALRELHAGILPLEIDGLALIDSYPRDLNGPWQLDLVYETREADETYDLARDTFVWGRIDPVLHDAGYELVSDVLYDFAEYVHPTTGGRVWVHMDEPLADVGPFRVRVSLHPPGD